jgi:hypothetical protein
MLSASAASSLQPCLGVEWIVEAHAIFPLHAKNALASPLLPEMRARTLALRTQRKQCARQNDGLSLRYIRALNSGSHRATHLLLNIQSVSVKICASCAIFHLNGSAAFGGPSNTQGIRLNLP